MPIHIEAEKGQVADSVILVGDPDRATNIADSFLEKTVCYNKYRHLYGYTGLYKGQKVSIQTSGMGSPSLSIVVEELNMLGVKRIVRLGTAGTISDNINSGDTVVATASHSSHDIYAREFPGGSFSAVPDFDLTMSLYTDSIEKWGKSIVHAGAILCSETFYEDSFELYKKFGRFGTLAVEMESYPLFYLCAKYNIKSGTILTISDIIFKKERSDKETIKNSIERNTKTVLDYFSNNKI